MIQPLWRTVWRFLKKLRIKLIYDPAILLLGMNYLSSKRQVLTVALFIIAKTQKQPRRPSRDEWKRKLWYI